MIPPNTLRLYVPYDTRPPVPPVEVTAVAVSPRNTLVSRYLSAAHVEWTFDVSLTDPTGILRRFVQTFDAYARVNVSLNFGTVDVTLTDASISARLNEDVDAALIAADDGDTRPLLLRFIVEAKDIAQRSLNLTGVATTLDGLPALS
ncbi:hypothetical protein [Acidisoma silvae]|uniref:Uncharacterized protein n=1 Tax=Acidisoma silvae TaxID=2802396 RepID=A0A964E1K1_9PROT|nr:hypothetical protein [Acidisoma silvae]MCB8878446.1 hypothetical protein [Acidisoma silvae]